MLSNNEPCDRDCNTCHRAECRETPTCPRRPNRLKPITPNAVSFVPCDEPEGGEVLIGEDAARYKYKPEDVTASTHARVKKLEQCLRICKKVIKAFAGDTVWADHQETLVDMIDRTLAMDNQGELFKEVKPTYKQMEACLLKCRIMLSKMPIAEHSIAKPTMAMIDCIDEIDFSDEWNERFRDELFNPKAIEEANGWLRKNT